VRRKTQGLREKISLILPSYYPYLATGATFEKRSEKPIGIFRSFGTRKRKKENQLFFCAHMHTVETK
jgi:hypothetical protein